MKTFYFVVEAGDPCSPDAEPTLDPLYGNFNSTTKLRRTAESTGNRTLRHEYISRLPPYLLFRCACLGHAKNSLWSV